MSVTETVLERNAELSNQLSEQQLAITPRVDPAYVLGLELGEAVVLRNPGGGVNPAFVQSLAVLRSVAVAEGFEPGFELIVMQHTDCGLTRLDGPDYSGMMAATSASRRTRSTASTSTTRARRCARTSRHCGRTRSSRLGLWSRGSSTTSSQGWPRSYARRGRWGPRTSGPVDSVAGCAVLRRARRTGRHLLVSRRSRT